MTTPVTASLNICRRSDYLSPRMQSILEVGLKQCRDRGINITPFETYRSPQRQDFLYAQGRTSPGKIVTQAEAWESYHQYGLAFDLACWTGKEWTWAGIDYAEVGAIFQNLGLKWLGPKDSSHLEMSLGISLTSVREIYINDGIHKVWEEAEFEMVRSSPRLHS